MAPRGAKKPPVVRRNRNDSAEADEGPLIKAAMEAWKLHDQKMAAFKSKMALNFEKNVSGPMKVLGIKMKHARADYENHTIETGKDENAVAKAAAERAMRLDTSRRIHAALHDGEQLNFLDIAKAADQARKEAEEEADAPTVTKDGGDEEEEENE